MKLAINTSSISFRTMGNSLVALGVLLLVVGIFAWVCLVPALASLALGLALRRSHRHIIRRPAQSVAGRLVQTLNLMGWKFSREGDTISVPATGTEVEARSFLGVSLLAFRHDPSDVKKQEFLEKTLVKYQRII